MGGADAPVSGPDFAAGVPSDSVVEGKPVLGHVGDQAVLLAKVEGKPFAVSAKCPHYGAPLADGIQVGATLRCPWHHARFDLRTGAVVCAPAMNPLSCFDVTESNGTLRVGNARPGLDPAPRAGNHRVVIIGSGAAGHSAAETLRREGLEGSITLIGADESVPYDRPNLSKDYLAGNAPEEWIPLRGEDFYREHAIDLRRGVRALKIDAKARTVSLSDGTTVGYDSLLLATGAEPIRLNIPGADRIRYLRTLSDSRALIAAAKDTQQAVVLGASFIGLEVAASLRARGIDVTVVAPEAVPLVKILGPQVGAFLKELHESHGVKFRLEQTATSIGSDSVTLQSGETIRADLVVAGIGVRPSLDLAQSAGIALDRGVKVNDQLETSIPGIWAAGDIARWPDPYLGENIRVEHWVVAQRQGQTAARNMLKRQERFDAVPFFWSAHYDVTLSYVGHAQDWDSVEIDGSLDARDCTLRYQKGGMTRAVVTLNRDIESLRAEAAMEDGVGAR